MSYEVFAAACPGLADLVAGEHPVRRALRILPPAAVGLALTASPALAAPCAGFDAVARRLEADYGEVRRAYGIAADGRLVILWAAEATGSWSITVSDPDGRTCLLASGDGFVALQPPEAKGDPA